MASTVEPTTPLELVETAYARYPRALADARRRLGRPLTFAEKILFAHADDPATIGLGRGVDYGDFRPDRVAMWAVFLGVMMVFPPFHRFFIHYPEELGIKLAFPRYESLFWMIVGVTAAVWLVRQAGRFRRDVPKYLLFAAIIPTTPTTTASTTPTIANLIHPDNGTPAASRTAINPPLVGVSSSVNPAPV